APYAERSASARRRLSVADEGREFDYRTQFQRDRDRIVYSRAFRRLRQKAQTGILPAYEDHRRNRLTHTIEVCQLARTVGRALALNEDLIEAIALGHDLGQPAFGAAGEQALDDLLSGRLDGRGGPGLGDLGGFSRVWQSLRVVDLIEKRYVHPGLNLTDAVREGIFKSGPPAATRGEAIEGVRQGLPPRFESQVVILADRIASALHDLDDALQSGAVALNRVERLHAVVRLRAKLGQRYRPASGRFMRANAIHRGLIHLMVTGAIVASERVLSRWAAKHGIDGPARFAALADDAVTGGEIDLPPAARRMLAEVESFLESTVRSGQAADRVDGRGRRVITGLFAAYHADPRLLEDHLLLRFKEIAHRPFLRDLPRAEGEIEIDRRYRSDARFARLLVDHLAAMTDSFALAEHRRLMEMGAVPIPGAEQLRRERRVDG
ncbi:MAG TPA: HD domain-containing protein, partial [Candidatus Polarisedimenticolaceae bacterium]|nr:HD domain-containing protein [Candidatus Polarisedimenticolaceae bacterium]